MALGAALLFGAAASFARLLLGAVEPQLLAGLLYLGAGIGLAAVHFCRAALGISAPEAPLRAGDLAVARRGSPRSSASWGRCC
jgi:hypothetical protein